MKKKSPLIHDIRVMLETLMSTDDKAVLGNIKPFISPVLERVREAMNKQTTKRKPSEEFPEYKQFVDKWHGKYPHLLKMPRDGAKIKSLILQTRQYVKNAGQEVNENNCIILWDAFVQNLYKTWYHGKDLAIIESKYPSILYELKNGKQNSKNNSAPSAKEFFRAHRQGGPDR